MNDNDIFTDLYEILCKNNSIKNIKLNYINKNIINKLKQY